MPTQTQPQTPQQLAQTSTQRAVQPANQYKPTVASVLTILAVGASVQATAAALAKLFKATSITPFTRALTFAKWKPGDSLPPQYINGRIMRYTTPNATIQNTNRMTTAAYIHGASIRMMAAETGASPDSVTAQVVAERKYAAMHEDAQKERDVAAQRLNIAQKAYGNTLGWYTKGDGQVETRCKKLSGHNFRTDRPLPIGYPGTIHPHCRCWAGPSYGTGEMLN